MILYVLLGVGKANVVVPIIMRSNRATDKKGGEHKVIFGCQKSRKYTGVGNGCCSATSSKKRNCQFKLRASTLIDARDCRVRVRCGLHNHDLHTMLTNLTFLGHLIKEERCMVREHTKLNDVPRDSYAALTLSLSLSPARVSPNPLSCSLAPLLWLGLGCASSTCVSGFGRSWLC